MELINFIMQYIPLDYMVIVLGLIVVGQMLKNFTTLPNQFLTTVLPVLGAVLMGIIYATGEEIFVAPDFIKQLCLGLAMGWTETGGYEFFKNTFLTKADEKKVISKEAIVKEDKNDEEDKSTEIENM